MDRDSAISNALANRRTLTFLYRLHQTTQITRAAQPTPHWLCLLDSPPSGVGAIRRFLGTASSLSDSLVSRLPRTLPLTELGALIPPPSGVCGGVVHGRVPNELLAATLGTLPSVGVGLLVMMPPEPCRWDDCVATDEAEFDRVGLGGCPIEPVKGDGDGAAIKEGAEIAVGVGVGVTCADETVETAGDGCWAVGTWPV